MVKVYEDLCHNKYDAMSKWLSVQPQQRVSTWTTATNCFQGTTVRPSASYNASNNNKQATRR
eukprot:283588-Amphidinium_carterae.2